MDAVLVLPFSRDLSLMTAQDFAAEVLAGKLHAREVHEGYNFHFGHKAQGNVATLGKLGRNSVSACRFIPRRSFAAITFPAAKFVS